MYDGRLGMIMNTSVLRCDLATGRGRSKPNPMSALCRLRGTGYSTSHLARAQPPATVDSQESRISSSRPYAESVAKMSSSLSWQSYVSIRLWYDSGRLDMTVMALQYNPVRRKSAQCSVYSGGTSSWISEKRSGSGSGTGGAGRGGS